MSKSSSRIVCIVTLLAITILTSAAPAQQLGLRRSAMVLAVEKTRPSIVTIRTPNPHGGKDLIGAGVIIDERGYIVTNRHVTAGKKTVKIRLHDGSEHTGAIIVADAHFDVAVIRIKTDKALPALRIIPADDLMVGETVFAVGHPLGYEGTVSRGIISALNREVIMPNEVKMSGLIQHDVPINPGNSGGPLINLNAEVIGINVAMRDNAQNIAFAINAHTIDGVLARLLSARKIAGIEHGLTCESAQPKVVIRAVADDSPAAHAAMRPGDIVLKIGDQTIANHLDLERAFWDRKPGERISIRILRQNEERTVEILVDGLARGN